MLQIANITDCQGTNAQMRLNLRINSLFPNARVEYVPVSNSIEAAGNVIDTLDAMQGHPCIVITNVAKRGETEGTNGVPFCFMEFKRNILVGTPHTFSLLQKLGYASHIKQTDVYTVCKKFLQEGEARRIANSQFRSFEYLPFLALWLSKGNDIPFERVEVPELKGNFVWHTDRFTDDPKEVINCKTTALNLNEITHPLLSKLPFVERLTDVKKGEAAITRGSSGYKSHRFLEIVVQRGSAAKTFKLKAGSKV